uniref:Uncharacterized protein n=1 Tax=Chromera velia CCMP2878 TaxID=1169474 RepID=A0A0G4I899_9ALVE|eukprot:Cvel_1987.t1-p1 / transcript=Cvel_1987.t1 / gene=Cvel_1987 / organism=Chromera_velia_CCMP2878 / gene_product=Phosphatidylcholine-sterol acyltransferase, putative / transcript_product=Phosphatidylcholine-sterol acyltransferase, putative / location=Cvel_scaffold75:124299-129484(-) / protein_length=885 / sequence_SO=supercontig / SO=protein_coding / is_pseudo=false
MAPRAPVILVPGLMGSGLFAKFENANVPGCTSSTTDWYRLWFSVSAALESECWLNSFQLEGEQAFEPRKGVQVTADAVGSVRGVEYLDYDIFGSGIGLTKYMADLIESLKGQGYTPWEDLFAAPYDWRRGPAGLFEEKEGGTEGSTFGPDLKSLIENSVAKSGRKAVLFSHSLGTLVTNFFLNKFVSKEWKDRHIERSVYVGGAFGGAPAVLWALQTEFSAEKDLNLGTDIFSGLSRSSLPLEVVSLLPQATRKGLFDAAKTFETTYSLLPDPKVYGESFVVASGPDGLSFTAGNFTGTDRLEDGDTVGLLKKKDAELALKVKKRLGEEILDDPGVPSVCVFGTAPDSTPVALKFDSDNTKKSPSLVLGDGDGAVPTVATSWCKGWEGSVRSVLVEKGDHFAMLKDPAVVKRLTEILTAPLFELRQPVNPHTDEEESESSTEILAAWGGGESAMDLFRAEKGGGVEIEGDGSDGNMVAVSSPQAEEEDAIDDKKDALEDVEAPEGPSAAFEGPGGEAGGEWANRIDPVAAEEAEREEERETGENVNVPPLTEETEEAPVPFSSESPGTTGTAVSSSETPKETDEQKGKKDPQPTAGYTKDTSSPELTPLSSGTAAGSGKDSAAPSADKSTKTEEKKMKGNKDKRGVGRKGGTQASSEEKGILAAFFVSALLLVAAFVFWLRRHFGTASSGSVLPSLTGGGGLVFQRQPATWCDEEGGELSDSEEGRFLDVRGATGPEVGEEGLALGPVYGGRGHSHGVHMPSGSDYGEECAGSLSLSVDGQNSFDQSTPSTAASSVRAMPVATAAASSLSSSTSFRALSGGSRGLGSRGVSGVKGRGPPGYTAPSLPESALDFDQRGGNPGTPGPPGSFVRADSAEGAGLPSYVG